MNLMGTHYVIRLPTQLHREPQLPKPHFNIPVSSPLSSDFVWEAPQHLLSCFFDSIFFAASKHW